MEPFTPRIFFFTCSECKRENIKASSNRQKYCKSCRDKVEKRKRKVYNARRKKETPIKQCIDCNLFVQEPYMQLRCKACADIEYNRIQRYCKSCKEVKLPSNRSICSDCFREKNLKRMKKNRIERTGTSVCRNVNCNNSLEGMSRGRRYCSDECKKNKQITYKMFEKHEPSENILKNKAQLEAEEKFEINPFYLKPRGSKRR